MNMHVAPAAADDRDLIRLCKKTVEALKADLAACHAKMDAQVAFKKAKPPYPVVRVDTEYGRQEWRYAFREDTSVAVLRAAVKRGGKSATPSWLANMREQIRAVAVWEQRIAELRRSTGLKAAEAKEERASRRASVLMKEIIETQAHTLQGAVAKAGIIEHWLDAGYALDEAGEGFGLVMVILDDIRIIGGDAGSIRLLRGHSDEPPPEHQMAGAA